MLSKIPLIFLPLIEAMFTLYSSISITIQRFLVQHIHFPSARVFSGSFFSVLPSQTRCLMRYYHRTFIPRTRNEYLFWIRTSYHNKNDLNFQHSTNKYSAVLVWWAAIRHLRSSVITFKEGESFFFCATNLYTLVTLAK